MFSYSIPLVVLHAAQDVLACVRSVHPSHRGWQIYGSQEANVILKKAVAVHWQSVGFDELIYWLVKHSVHEALVVEVHVLQRGVQAVQVYISKKKPS